MDVVRKLFVACVLVLSTVLVPSTLSEETSDAPDVLSERYTVEIMDAYAVTDVERVLYNPSNKAIDHTFMFNIPRDAMISNFSIEVENLIYYADVLDKEVAKEKYQKAVDEGRNAGLVASLGNQTFAYKVSIRASEEMTATIRYEQVLLKVNGWHTYGLPLVSGSDPYEVGTFDVDITIDSPSDIDEIKTKGYDDTLRTSVPESDRARVTLTGKDFTADDDLEVRWRTIGGASEGKMYFGKFDGMGYFVHIFDPDPVNFGDDRVSKDFIFILDKSGSMRNVKFDQATTALDHIYGSLIKDDRFSFVWFNGDSSIYSNKLLRANRENVDDVRNYIDDLAAGGSTNIHAGVIDALDIFKAAGDTVPIVVLLTDGKANTGLYERSSFREDVRTMNTVDASIYCIALGNRAEWTFVEALALENDGRAIWVLEHEDVVTEISDFVRSFSSPLLAQLSFDYGPSVVDVHPSQVPAHYEGTEVLVTGRFPIDTGKVPMSLDAISADGTFLIQAEFSIDDGHGGDFVPRFWAYQRIKELQDHMKYNGTDNDTVDEIVQLGIDFHFATDHTSLFVELPEEILERFYGDEAENIYLNQGSGHRSPDGTSPAAYDSGAYAPAPSGPSQEDSASLAASGMVSCIGI
ncbi:MAG: VWA domain-containing protein, partial [Thermoplasmata archaeon]|nr:VWA domain-containing protein [Thermoplasmata archaeon]